jgi:ABC-2 type transport system ATP-binding protein
MTDQPIIQVENLTFAYAKAPVLDDLSFTMRRGATGLLGPNGAGKSTLIKILLGFLKPRRGRGAVLGIPIGHGGAAIRQRIGYMPENESTIPSLKAIRLVTYSGELNGMPWAEAMQRAHETLFYVGLGEARYREVGQFSTGMRQRIKLAQALVHAPEILFLDEPTNGLDPAGRRDMLDLIRDIIAQGQTSVLFSSHILQDVEAACEDVIVLKKGRVVLSGCINELKQTDQNIVEVRLKGEAGRFLEALGREGFRHEMQANGLIRLHVPDSKGSEAIFAAAQESGVQIRHLMHRRDTLEDVFIAAIEEETAKQEVVQVGNA